MQGSLYREVFPTFLAKKSYDWWITRRRMEIYTKISKRKDLNGVGRTEENLHHAWAGVRNFAQGDVLCEFRTS